MTYVLKQLDMSRSAARTAQKTACGRENRRQFYMSRHRPKYLQIIAVTLA